jgi:hypothetical protein
LTNTWSTNSAELILNQTGSDDEISTIEFSYSVKVNALILLCGFVGGGI